MQDSPRIGLRFRARHVLRLLAILPLLASCAAPTMRNQFRDYDEAYADSLNQQMLLNLARLANGHPAYYLAIGLIDQRYTFSSQTGAGVSGGLQDTHTSTQNTPFTAGTPSSIASFPLTVLQKVWQTTFGGNGNETVTASSNPEFQFIPINNQETAEQVLQPQDPNVFLSLYQQGYPIDQLMRMMIERIDAPDLPGGQHIVLVNSPKSLNPMYYERFLRTCAILRTLQMNGYLWLDAQSQLEPLGPISFSSRPGGGNQQTSPEGANPNPAPTDFADAQKDNMLLIYTNLSVTPEAPLSNKLGWMAYRKTAVPKFFLRYEYEPTPTQRKQIEEWHYQEEQIMGTNANESTWSQAMNNDEVQQFECEITSNLLARANPLIRFLEVSNADEYGNVSDNYEAITNVVAALCAGVSIQTDLGQGDPTTTRLVLRSFNRTMESVATEQPGFEALATNDSDRFTNCIPDFERRPILQMLWTANKPDSLEAPTENVQYAGKSYEITDPIMSPTNAVASWNRDTFRLLVGLNSLVTVDIAKFQRQVLELEQ